jgi:hypothetical protein
MTLAANIPRHVFPGRVTMEIIGRHIFHRDMSQGVGFVGRIPLTW